MCVHTISHQAFEDNGAYKVALAFKDIALRVLMKLDNHGYHIFLMK
jgi:hypothetical protein